MKQADKVHIGVNLHAEDTSKLGIVFTHTKMLESIKEKAMVIEVPLEYDELATLRLIDLTCDTIAREMRAVLTERVKTIQADSEINV